MGPQFWNDRWQKGETGFHQAEVHDLLVKHWPKLDLAPASSVFVPLCGKSLDMVWLAEEGHHVIGAELSTIAVDTFFDEHGLTPSIEETGSFTVKSAGPYQIWQGDFFDLPGQATADIAAVYDRAALVAIPRPDQPRYAAKLIALAPARTPIALVGLDFDQAEMDGPPFATGLQHIAYAFGQTHTIALAESREALEQNPGLRQRGLTALRETLYFLRPK